MSSFNCYEDARRAEAYARLEFPGTYYLAYRDLPEIIRAHVRGGVALDFGCGAGRSTRFLAGLGLRATGVDIAADMLRKAREFDPPGDYRQVSDGGPLPFAEGVFDLVLSAFTFDNVPGREKKVAIFRELRRVLADSGWIISLVSAPEIYTHEWASFSTRDFPENQRARCGDVVWIINTAIDDRRPVPDILWPDADYRSVYREAGLRVAKVYRPLGRPDEPFPWVNETRIPPWVIYVLKKSSPRGRR